DVGASSSTATSTQQAWLAQGERIVVAYQGFDDLDGAVHHQQVKAAVVVDVHTSGTESGVGETGVSDACRCAAILKVRRAVVDVEIGSFASQIRHNEILIAVVVEVRRVDTHPRLRLPIFAERHAGERTGVHARLVA